MLKKKECKMSKRLKSTLIACTVTFVWFILMCVVLASVDFLYLISYYGTFLIMDIITKLLCICSVPTMFITVYEGLCKEDTSWFKYIVAAIFVVVFVCVFNGFNNVEYRWGAQRLDKMGMPIILVGAFITLLTLAFTGGISYGIFKLFGKVCNNKPIVKYISVFVFLLFFPIICQLLFVLYGYSGYYGNSVFVCYCNVFIYRCDYSTLSFFVITHIFENASFDTVSSVSRKLGIFLPTILAILPMAFIVLRGRCASKTDVKSLKIKSKIDASFIANFAPVLMMTLSGIIYNILQKKEQSYFGEIAIIVGSVISSVFFLIFYETQRKEKSVIKYIQLITIQYLFGFFAFASLFNIYAEYLIYLFIPAIICMITCLITELKGKPLTQIIASGIRKLSEKTQGDRVKAEKISEIKSRTKIRLGGRIFAGSWFMMMFAGIIYDALTGLVAFTVIGAILVIGPITYGLAKTEANVITGKKEQADLADLFSGFSENFTQSIVLWLLQNIFLALWSMLFVILGIIKYYAYSMSFYIQQQSANKNWKYALDESNRLMCGNKFKLFLLDLSFIGWYMLGGMCFGIGILFVIPYHRTARAAFFDSLISANKIKEERLPAESKYNEACECTETV